MQRTMLQAKLHRVTCSHSELDYEGSCAIDRDLLDASGIRDYQQIDVYNVTNGERFTTYAIAAERASRIISLNGAAAHRAKPGDVLIIAAYASYSEAEIASHRPKLVFVDSRNRVRELRGAIPVQTVA